MFSNMNEEVFVWIGRKEHLSCVWENETLLLE